MAEVNVPIVGKVPRGWLIAVGVGSAGVIFIVLRRQKANAAASATSAGGTGAIDPATGFPYGSPEDQAALGGGQGAIDPATGLPYADEFGGGLGGLGGLGLGGGGQGGTGPTLPGPGSFTSNAEWAQYAEQQLAGIVPAAPLSAALGKYLTGGAVNRDQHSLIDQAIAIAGYPPTAGPGGHPPAIRSQAGGGQGGGGKGHPVRHIATGKQSLQEVAAGSQRTVEAIEDVTEAVTTPISKANRERFIAYVKGGTNKRMPPGLVYFTSK